MRSSTGTAIQPKPNDSPFPRPQPPLAPRPPGPVDPVIGAGGTPPIIIIESPRPLEHFQVKWIRFTADNAVHGKTRADSAQTESALGPPDPNDAHRGILRVDA